ncbi:hypothetical protein CR492_04665 [Methylocella silvestris]|uniref:DUF6950 domain-containing protein n=1 Tax=Methylocella silvestris TaxID=199596 RepID=A0A2J7TJQ5_METSI|nr:hypothetical protein CR492_04665 [Methylocella silvestris]
MTLEDYLRAAAARPFRWGECDCCLFVADWIKAVHGFDVANGWRGAYSDERGARRALVMSGGLVRLMSLRMQAHGLAPTDTPRPGDIGVVEATAGATAAIRGGRGWICKTPEGIGASPFRVIGAWSI